MKIILGNILLILGLASPALAEPPQLQLVDKGQAESVIVAPPGSMHWEGDELPIDMHGRMKGKKSSEVAAEKLRRFQRDSIQDLANTLKKISGADIEVIESLPKEDPRAPIYIGSVAEQVFGPVGISKAGKFGFRMVADKRGLGLYGESEHGTSYAIYEFLHRLGCRWYLPSELGECLPQKSTISVAYCDDKLAPATEYRDVWSRTADEDFRRRNRLGGDMVASMHFLEKYITPEQREAHPEWRLLVDGKPEKVKLRWTREDVADAVAEDILRRLEADPVSSVSLSPGDYVVPTEDPEERKHDPEPRVWEPAAGRWSVTDRLMMLTNRVADRVTKTYPDLLFGVAAYVNYNSPPAREPVHPNVIPVIAPIDFNRHHPMTWENHPNKTWLKDLVEGWGAKAKRWGYYGYAMNLAELSAPNPLITKWGTDIPILLKNGMTHWMPETMGGWESMMPGYYLSFRMTFDPSEKPEDILSEMWKRLYGAAAEPMERYWQLIDHAWISTGEYAGAQFGYLKMFPPEMMAEARAAIDEALAKVQTPLEYQRVKMIEESLALFEKFMAMREDYAAGRLNRLEKDLTQWRASLAHLQNRYQAQYAFGFPYGPSTMTEHYVNIYCGTSYADASQMEKNFSRVGQPMIDWKWKYNPGLEADSLPWTKPDYDDKDWPTLNVVRDTWSSIGHHNSLTDESAGTSGRMAYRKSVRLPALPEGKRVWLWLAATDGDSKVFVNGKAITYVVPEDTRTQKAGDRLESFSGFCQPARFDVTDALVKGENQITILCDRNRLWELGTGGLIGPVALYREK